MNEREAAEAGAALQRRMQQPEEQAAHEAIRVLVKKHNLGFLHNPGGGAFNRHDLGDLQVTLEDGDVAIHTALSAWLQAKGLEAPTTN
ncbi:MAG TPA: hypothetical protein VKA83_09365 [Methylomirabilota bacterium]|nr:hypothetical protein [Methylomirabilota bacterium]